MTSKDRERFIIKRENTWALVIAIVFIIILGLGLAISIRTITDLEKQLEIQQEFEPIKEGLCVYVEYPNGYTGDFPIPDYLLVYDYETEKVIEVDIFSETVHTRIYVGDTILYVVDYDYTDADFLNVIKGG